MRRLRTTARLSRSATLAVLAVAASVSAVAAATSELVYVGTHGASPPGAAAGAPAEQQGIYDLRLNPKSGELTAPSFAMPLQRATWFAVNPKLPVIYSVAAGSGSQPDSDLYSLKVDGASGALQVINKVDSGGKDATALDLDPASWTLLAAHYGSGTLSALPINADGSLGAVASTQTDVGTGPSPRQKSAHAHDVALSPDGHYALVSDLGADKIFVYPFDPKTRTLAAAVTPIETVTPGSGPRHLMFAPGGKYVLVNTELTAELRSYAWNAKSGTLKLVQDVQAYPAGQEGDKSLAELAFSKDGRFVYLSLRGDQNSLVVYDFDKHTGMLSELQRISCGGKMPWSFGIDPSGRWLLVTNESSDAVVEFSIDRTQGTLTATGRSVTVPQPVAVAFLAH